MTSRSTFRARMKLGRSSVGKAALLPSKLQPWIVTSEIREPDCEDSTVTITAVDPLDWITTFPPMPRIWMLPVM